MISRPNPKLAIVLGLAVLAGCASGPTATTSPLTPQSSANRHGTGNIYWSRASLDLRYPAKAWRTATLSYWGANGYFTLPLTCANGGTVTFKVGKPFGNSAKYEHVVFRFKARTAGSDSCSLSAVLADTGSPPIATIDLNIVGK